MFLVAAAPIMCFALLFFRLGKERWLLYFNCNLFMGVGVLIECLFLSVSWVDMCLYCPASQE